MDNSEKIQSIKKLAAEIRELNAKLENELVGAEYSTFDTGCNRGACSCQQYSRGIGDGICGTCFHPAYEHL